MAYFQLLGTGPIDASATGIGRNRRRPASAALHHISTYLLFDSSSEVLEQVEQALSVTHVALTGLSKSRTGSLAALDAWLEHSTPLYVVGAPTAELARRAAGFSHLVLTQIEPLVPQIVSDITLTAFPLIGPNGATPKDGLFGYHVDTGKKRITHAPAFVSVPPESLAFFSSLDLLVVDGGGWDKDTKDHAGALPHLTTWLANENAAVIFTGLSEDAPPHTLAVSQVRRASHRADVAFDFMKFPLGR